MNIIARYKRLTFWSKVGFWGAICSIIAFILTLVGLYFDKSKTSQLADDIVTKLKEEMRSIDAARHEDLIKRYSLGYILFYIDRTSTVIPYESRLKTECAVDLSEARVAGISDEGIMIELPNIECSGGPTFIRCGGGISRVVGQPTPIFGRFHGIQMYLEMLVDHGDSFVCVLGFSSV